MDDFNNEGLGYLFIMLIIVGIMMLLFIVSYYNLYRFKKCYDNNFSYKWCENYKNY